MRKNIFFFLLFCLVPASAGFAQTKRIDREEFYKPYRAALKSFNENSHRLKVIFENYENGVLKSTDDWTHEYVKPDRRRYVEVRTSGNTVSRAESIDTGSAKYCRKNDGEWKITSGSCGMGGGSGGPSQTKSETFTVENARIDGRKVKIYRSRYVYEREKLGSTFWQTSFWLDEKGTLLREETRVGTLEPERLSWKSDTRFEYDPAGLKIEAPPIGPAKTQ